MSRPSWSLLHQTIGTKLANGLQNPADCASQGLYTSELLDFSLSWDKLEWLRLTQDEWPKQSVCWWPSRFISQWYIALDWYSSFTRLIRITAWILRFTLNCWRLASSQDILDISFPLHQRNQSSRSKEQNSPVKMLVASQSTSFWTELNYYELLVTLITLLP